MSQTPLESFIDYKADTGMQCGNYSIDLPKLQEGEQYRFHFDATKCIGCRCCEVACNEQNNNPADIKWRRVGEMESGEFGQVTQLFNSMSCNHCVDPACLIGCPTNSYIKFDNGIVFHDDPSCIGCQYCTWNCPYSVPTFHQERHIVTKCHMCHERLAVDQSPACVQACPSGAIEIEAVQIEEWLEKGIDMHGNMPSLVDARVTNATTRFTLPENLDVEALRAADAHRVQAFHPEWPLAFMTSLTQVSLGAFIALFLGELLFALGISPFEPTLFIALVVLAPAAIGLPLSALHLGRPIKALSAFKNIKTSWLSREGLALALYAGTMTLVSVLFILEIDVRLRLLLESAALLFGLYGIHAQAMIYRIEARPSWNRVTTNMKFFAVSYLGFFLVAFSLLALHSSVNVSPILTIGLLVALAQLFFSVEDYKTIQNHAKERYAYEMGKSAKLYAQRSALLYTRFALLVVSAIVLPVVAIFMISTDNTFSATIVMTLALLGAYSSELIDRHLFYVTSVGLSMAGGFFVGDQRGDV